MDSGNELFHQARDIRDKLALVGGHDRLLAKIDALLALNSLHGGQAITLRNHLDAAREFLK